MQTDGTLQLDQHKKKSTRSRPCKSVNVIIQHIDIFLFTLLSYLILLSSSQPSST